MVDRSLSTLGQPGRLDVRWDAVGRHRFLQDLAASVELSPHDGVSGVDSPHRAAFVRHTGRAQEPCRELILAPLEARDVDPSKKKPIIASPTISSTKASMTARRVGSPRRSKGVTRLS